MDTPRWNRQPFKRPVVPEHKENSHPVPPPSFRRYIKEQETRTQKPPEPPEEPKKRRRRKSRLHISLPRISPRVTGAVLGVVAAAIGIYIFIHQPWFHFGRVKLSGNKYVTLEEVMDAGSLKDPVNILTIDRSALRQALAKDPRIEKVDFSFGLPNYLVVHVKEREPVMYMRCDDGSFAKISKDGYVISKEGAIEDATAPLVTGFTAEGLEEGDEITGENLKAMCAFLGKLPAGISDRISEISLDERMRITLYIEGGVPFIVGTGVNALNRIDTFISLCDDLEQKKIKARYIDMTYAVPYIKVE
ncbi:MAG: FtsQ-type POTRA domain-containing protein [Acidaminococcus sp.]|jgi:cell division protein FtsQ|nr:FtsQ-type POTRA domain-containing protein [Acidaminococcus sp.]MCI2100140.1 FtsQ-type POTRA domain-containing protein [Acidaminococcus sp.]MCI2114459.1 FtsQ-type POTRA domain-containing protein [Acidaminococcus sp.]MCI2116394.1 FtsQ-type POTRA domain-containing protein [Acidaminococcus sp.]